MAAMQAAELLKPRQGPPLGDGPWALAATNAGLSLRAFAQQWGISYTAMKSRNDRKSGTLADRKALAKRPYSVPPEAWTK